MEVYQQRDVMKMIAQFNLKKKKVNISLLCFESR